MKYEIKGDSLPLPADRRRWHVLDVSQHADGGVCLPVKSCSRMFTRRRVARA